jgi:hypothetical protein
VKRECKDQLVRKVQLEQLDFKVHRGRKVQPEQLVELVQQELQGRKVQQDPLELPERLVQREQRERLVLKVPLVLQLLGTTDRFMTQPHK